MKMKTGLFTNIDMYGKKFQFKFEGDTFKTIFGAIISLIMGLATLGLCCYFGLDLYYKESPFVLEKLDYLDYSPLIKNHNRSNTFVAFRLKGPYYDDLRYFEHSVIYYYKNTNGKGNSLKTFGSTHKCKPDEIDQDNWSRNELGDYFCYDQEDSTIGGPDVNFTSHYPALVVKFCGKDTEKRYNITCASQKELDLVVANNSQKKYIEVVYQANLVHHSSVAYPYKRKYYSTSLGIDLSDKKAFYQGISYRTSYIQTDTGLIFKDSHKTPLIEFDSMSVLLEPSSGDFFAKVYISISRAEKTYFKSYVKLLDVIANVGGFISLAHSFFHFVYSFYLDNEFRVYLYKKLFKLEIDNDNNESEIIDPKQVINYIKPHCENNKLEVSNTGLLNLENNNNLNNIDKNNNVGINHMNEKPQNSPSLSVKKKSQILFKNIKGNNDKDIVLNKELKNVLNFQKRFRTQIEINSNERCYFTYCCPYKKETIKSINMLRYELSIAAEKAIYFKTKIFEIWKTLDQFRLFIKLILNESQCFMLQNRGKQLITNDVDLCLSNLEIKKIEEIKLEKAHI